MRSKQRCHMRNVARYKTTLCYFYPHCEYGELCCFAHEIDELRAS